MVSSLAFYAAGSEMCRKNIKYLERNLIQKTPRKNQNSQVFELRVRFPPTQ